MIMKVFLVSGLEREGNVNLSKKGIETCGLV